jgi:hypothetical protein
MYELIFKGADAVFAGADASSYSWNNILEFAQIHAEIRAENRTTYKNPEIYGVSGVSTNRFRPAGDPPPARFERSLDLAIPTVQGESVDSTIEVPAGLGAAADGRVEIRLYRPGAWDVEVTLSHGADRVTLEPVRTAGDSPVFATDLAAFGGDAEGDWTVTVKNAWGGGTTGRLVYFALDFEQ